MIEVGNLKKKKENKGKIIELVLDIEQESKGDVRVENVDTTGREIIQLSHKKGMTHCGIHEGKGNRKGKGGDGMNDLKKKVRMGIDWLCFSRN